MTSFIGRHADLAAVRALLARERLVSIVGLGGLGKSRLAAQLGVLVAEDWIDGVWIVDLSAVSSDVQLRPNVAAALGVGVSSDENDYDLTATLRDRHVLLILDGCERIIDASAALAEELVHACPRLAILATSQMPLDLPSEVMHRLAPLPLEDDALELFLERARHHGGEPERGVAEQIVRHLDGMPLALELAASRVSVMAPVDILRGMDRRFGLLRATSRGLPERQRTMRGLLDWSVELLDPGEQLAFERLSIFAAPFDIATATAALADAVLSADDVPLHIWSLTEKSLLVLETAGNGTRYRMFETVRACAAERLRTHGDGDAHRAALAAWYLERFPLLRRGDQAWLSALGVEVDNVSALIDEMAPNDDELPALARLRAEVRSVRAEIRTAIEEIDRVLARRTTWTPPWVRLALFAASLFGDLGDVDEAFARSDLAEAELDGESVDRWGSVRAASPRPILLLRHGDLAAAHRAAQSAAELPSNGDRATSLLHLALITQAMDGSDAVDLYREIINLAHERGDHVLIALALNNLAECKLRAGALDEAAALQRESLVLSAVLGMKQIAAVGLIVAARMAEQTGTDERAVRLHARADAILDETGIQLFDDDLQAQ